MDLKDRIRFIRRNLATRTKGGRTKHMTLDEFAKAVGAKDRHRPIGWEKGQTPRDYAEQIAKLTPYPSAAVGGDGEAALLRETYGHRLRSLEGEADEARSTIRGLLLHLNLELVPAAGGGDPGFRPIQQRRAATGKRR